MIDIGIQTTFMDRNEDNVVQFPKLESYVPYISLPAYRMSKLIGEELIQYAPKFSDIKHGLKNKESLVFMDSNHPESWVKEYKSIRTNSKDLGDSYYNNVQLSFGLGIYSPNYYYNNYLKMIDYITHLLYIDESQSGFEYDDVSMLEKRFILLVSRKYLGIKDFVKFLIAYPSGPNFKSYLVDEIPFSVTPFVSNSSEISLEDIQKNEDRLNLLIRNQWKQMSETWKS